MPADGDCIENNSHLPRAQHHFAIKQLPIQLGSNIAAEVFDVVPGPLQPLTSGPEWISIVNDSQVSLSKTRHSDCLMFIDSKSAVSNPYEIWPAVLLASQDFRFLWIVRTNLPFSVTPTCTYLTGTRWICPLRLSHTMTVCAERHWDISKCSETERSLLSTECLSWVLEDKTSPGLLSSHITVLLRCAPLQLHTSFVREMWCVQVCMHNERRVEELFFLPACGILYWRKWREDNIVSNLICTPCMSCQHCMLCTQSQSFLHFHNMVLVCLCVVVCVLCYLLSYSPALTSKSSHLTTVVLLSTCQRRKLILRQINTLFSLSHFFYIHSRKQPSF